jgi:hypothetical protein
MSQCRFWIQPNGCQSHCINLWQIRMVMVHFGLRASGESDVERIPKRTGPSGPLAAWRALYRAIAICRWCVLPRDRGRQQHGTIERYGTGYGDRRSQGMMIAEVNVGIGVVDRILKMTKDGKSNNRELTNARAELDHWRARLLKTVHRGTPQRSRLPGALSPSTK